VSGEEEREVKTIIHTVYIASPASVIFEALTTEQGVTGWWSTKADVEAEEGGVIRFTFRGDFNPSMRQVRLERGTAVEWECIAGHDNWQDNRFRFALRPDGQGTSLQFVQEYAQELDDDTYGTYNFNWGYYLNSLKRYCETGVGAPYQVPAE
jgi:uncharacterized protein YndB with AHSA1/START domain